MGSWRLHPPLPCQEKHVAPPVLADTAAYSRQSSLLLAVASTLDYDADRCLPIEYRSAQFYPALQDIHQLHVTAGPAHPDEACHQPLSFMAQLSQDECYLPTQRATQLVQTKTRFERTFCPQTHFLLNRSPSLLYLSAMSGYCSACCST